MAGTKTAIPAILNAFMMWCMLRASSDRDDYAAAWSTIKEKKQ